jgi:hypothetical protein
MTNPTHTDSPHPPAPLKRRSIRARILPASVIAFFGVCFLITSTEILWSRLINDTMERSSFPRMTDREWSEVQAVVRACNFATFLTRSICCLACFLATWLWMRGRWVWALASTVVLPFVAQADNVLNERLVPRLARQWVESTNR